MPQRHPVIERASRPDQAIVAALSDPGAASGRRLEACRHLIEMGALEDAARALARLEAEPGAAPEAAVLLRICRRLQTQAPHLHDVIATIETDPEAACWWAAPAGAQTTIVAFAGTAQKVGISVYFLCRILTRLGCNVLILFDTSNRLYLRGVAGLGDSVTATVSMLRPIIDGMRGRWLVCLGQSAGGFGAIRYGRSLGADAVLAFSPLVYPTRKRRLACLQGLGLTDLPEETIDLRAQRLRDPSPPRLHIVHGALHAGDTASARSLADLPGVTTAAIEGLSEHGSLQSSVVAGTFVERMESFLAELGMPDARRSA